MSGESRLSHQGFRGSRIRPGAGAGSYGRISAARNQPRRYTPDLLRSTFPLCYRSSYPALPTGFHNPRRHSYNRSCQLPCTTAASNRRRSPGGFLRIPAVASAQPLQAPSIPMAGGCLRCPIRGRIRVHSLGGRPVDVPVVQHGASGVSRPGQTQLKRETLPHFPAVYFLSRGTIGAVPPSSMFFLRLSNHQCLFSFPIQVIRFRSWPHTTTGRPLRTTVNPNRKTLSDRPRRSATQRGTTGLPGIPRALAMPGRPVPGRVSMVPSLLSPSGTPGHHDAIGCFYPSASAAASSSSPPSSAHANGSPVPLHGDLPHRLPHRVRSGGVLLSRRLRTGSKPHRTQESLR